MVTQEETYRGKQIRIEIDEEGDDLNHDKEKVRLYINNQHVHVMSLPSGQYSTHYLPYYIFPNVLKLAVTVIDKVPFFNLKKD